MKHPHRNRKFRTTQVAVLTAGLALLSALSCTAEVGDDSVASSSAELTLGTVNVLTRNYNNGRTGANTLEAILKPS
ncbi:MAG TPA: hypothetical protein VGF76_21070, partial [Polyangiaceae bacterium]